MTCSKGEFGFACKGLYRLPEIELAIPGEPVYNAASAA
jgi:hypothetical protein